MKQITVNEWLEKNKYLKTLSQFTLFVEKEIYESYKNDKKIKIENKEISIKLLKDLVTNDLYYKYVEQFFNKQNNFFQCGYIINGDVSPYIYLDKKDIVLGLTKCIQENKFTLNPKASERYNILLNQVNYNKLLNEYQNINQSFTVDNTLITIPFNTLIDFFELSDNEYENFLNNDNNSLLNGIKKEYFLYCVHFFFTQKKINNNYILPSFIINKINKIENDQRIDIEAINKLTKTDFEVINQINVNPKLKEVIYENMPKSLSSLEKAIYIYIKMCKILKYDGEFYSENQKGPAAIKHENINNLFNITPENNEAVCYEFNAIYAKLLNELNINVQIHSRNVDGFGGGHANLTFRFDKYLIQADSVTRIINGDLIRAKLNYPLEGLKCSNKNKKTKNEFKECISKIYNLIALEENKKNIKIEETESFDDILLKYKKTTSNHIYLDINEKLNLLITKLTDSNLTGMDAFSYILILKKIIFDQIEQEYNIKITIIRNNELGTDDKQSLPSAIITLNNYDIVEFETNTYYLYIPKEPLYYIPFKDLKKKFKKGIFEYVTTPDDKEIIPGIFIGKGRKK